MKLIIEKSVTVITPSIGSEKLRDAIKSVNEQTYKNIKHLIVVDGEENVQNVVDNSFFGPKNSILKIAVIPENTGANGFYGHRIYAGYPHFINSDYVFFLDEDNWYEEDHVASLVEVLDRGNDFAYSLRKIFNPDKSYVADDNCEALGKWPIYFSHDDPQYLVDTSSFAFNIKFLRKTCHHWHHGWGGDRFYLYNALRYDPKWDTNGKHTLCYRLDGNPGSVNADFFNKGNEVQMKHYNGALPWIS